MEASFEAFARPPSPPPEPACLAGVAVLPAPACWCSECTWGSTMPLCGEHGQHYALLRCVGCHAGLVKRGGGAEPPTGSAGAEAAAAAAAAALGTNLAACAVPAEHVLGGVSEERAVEILASAWPAALRERAAPVELRFRLVRCDEGAHEGEEGDDLAVTLPGGVGSQPSVAVGIEPLWRAREARLRDRGVPKAGCMQCEQKAAVLAAQLVSSANWRARLKGATPSLESIEAFVRAVRGAPSGDAVQSHVEGMLARVHNPYDFDEVLSVFTAYNHMAQKCSDAAPPKDKRRKRYRILAYGAGCAVWSAEFNVRRPRAAKRRAEHLD